MMDIQQFTTFMQGRKITDELRSKVIETVTRFKNYTEQPEKPDYHLLAKQFSKDFIAGQEDAASQVLALAYYFLSIRDEEMIAYFMTTLGIQEVIESQKERMTDIVGEQKTHKVFEDLNFPLLGTPYEEYLETIQSYLANMQKELSREECETVLTGNHHKIPLEIYDDYVKRFEETKNLDLVLQEKHNTLVKTLQEHCDTGRLWYEQFITQPVVDFVKDNQEIQTGVREGNIIYIQKIPYSPDAWFKETDPDKKRHLACHCPFVRNAIAEEEKVPSLWCYCTAGFESVMFNRLFNQELKVKVLKSVLDKDQICRFAIYLPEDWEQYPK